MAKRKQLATQLEYRWKNGENDVSDLLRGQIAMVDEFIGLREIFKRYDKLKEDIENYEKLVTSGSDSTGIRSERNKN